MKGWIYLLGMLVFATSCSSLKQIKEVQQPENTPSNQFAQTTDTLALPLEKEYSQESIVMLIEAGKERALGNDQRAVTYYLQALQIDPDNDAAHFELAKIYEEQGLLSKSLIHAERAASIDSTNKWYMDFYGNSLINEQQFDKGIAIYKQLSEQYPNDIDYLYSLAFAYQQGGQLAEAIDTYGQVETLAGSGDPSLIFRKHRLYAEQGDIDKAAQEIEKLIEQNPSETRYVGYLAEFYELNNMPRKAIEQYDELLELEPNNPQALVAKADLYLQLGERDTFQSSINSVINSEAFSMDEKIKVLYPMVDDISENAAFKDVYLAAAKLLVETYPNEAKPLALYGDFLYNSGQLENSIESYEKAISLRPDVFSVWEQLMFIYSTKNQFTELIDVAERATKVHEEEPLPFYMGGFGHYQLKEYEAATKFLEEGIKLEAPKTMAAEMNSLLGDSYNALEEYDASYLSYDRALLFNPDNVYILNNYSYYLAIRGEQLDKADKMISRAIQLAPNDANILDTYAWVKFKRGEFQEALPYMEKALELDKNNPTLVEHYGDILYKLGRKAEALRKWEKANDLGKATDTLMRKINDKQYYEY
ncbi:MAG: tetratricopeptide repeat protein [Saprospiraceae bacterium]|nr:tetratricopeptide repeat protein [Saprospiraceae bacterium]